MGQEPKWVSEVIVDGVKMEMKEDKEDQDGPGAPVDLTNDQKW